MRGHEKTDSGFVLVNALVLVAALAATATFLLFRAETGRMRLEVGQSTVQLGFYLDGFEMLASTLLQQDRNQTDHPSDGWANADYNVEVDRGRVSGEISDLQGLFNINWLADSSNTAAKAAFERFLVGQNISTQVGEAIVDFLRNGGPSQRQPYLRQSPALDPVGGALLRLAQLADIPAISSDIFEALDKVATAIPGDSQLNINTASRAVLISFLPTVRSASLDGVLAQRRIKVFESVEEFKELIEPFLDQPLDDILGLDRISVRTDWFQVDTQAQLGTFEARRRSVVFRQSAPFAPVTRWRQTIYP